VEKCRQKCNKKTNRIATTAKEKKDTMAIGKPAFQKSLHLMDRRLRCVERNGKKQSKTKWSEGVRQAHKSMELHEISDRIGDQRSNNQRSSD